MKYDSALGIFGNLTKLYEELTATNGRHLDGVKQLSEADAENRMELEQEITDAYLDNIEAEQAITDLYLEIIGG